MTDAEGRVAQAEKKYRQRSQAWEGVGISEEVKLAQNVRTTVNKRERGKGRQGFVIQCSSGYDKTLWLLYGEWIGGEIE